MITFQVNDMTCGHCVGQITKAVKAADPQAALQFDLASHQVQITPDTASAGVLTAAISAAGYTPVLARTQTGATPAPQAQARSGCCCRTARAAA